MKLIGTKEELIKLWRDRAKLLYEMHPKLTRRSSCIEKRSEAAALLRCADDLEMLQEPKEGESSEIDDKS